MILLLGMEDMNVNSGAFYGVNMAEYGHNSGVRVGSMMALMTEQEQEHEEASSMAFPSYNNGHVEAALLSAAAIFHGGGDLSLPGHHHSKHPVGGHFQSEQLPMNEQAVVFSDSSLSSVKTEIYSNSLELASKGEGAARWSFWPDPSLVLRALSQSQYQQQQKQVMATSLEAESECCSNPKDFIDAMKIRIAGHPNYPRLLAAYIDCHKIGTSPEVIALLDEISEKNRHGRRSPTISIGADPELDQFMEAYYSTLGKHQIELSKTFKEAMAFINEMETRLNSLGIDCPPGYFDEREEGEGDGGCGSSEEELSCCGELEFNHDVDPRAEDRQLKDQLLRKYSGYFSTLKKEFLKKRKKGKLPKEARQTLLEWWHLHNKWPYPSETDKVVLAESTGLDQKQINNWFINQRKRHWKPSEDMQLMVMDGLNSHTASFFIDGIDC